jgi:hypothetical protein
MDKMLNVGDLSDIYDANQPHSYGIEAVQDAVAKEAYEIVVSFQKRYDENAKASTDEKQRNYYEAQALAVYRVAEGLRNVYGIEKEDDDG